MAQRFTHITLSSAQKQSLRTALQRSNQANDFLFTARLQNKLSATKTNVPAELRYAKPELCYIKLELCYIKPELRNAKVELLNVKVALCNLLAGLRYSKAQLLNRSDYLFNSLFRGNNHTRQYRYGTQIIYYQA